MQMQSIQSVLGAAVLSLFGRFTSANPTASRAPRTYKDTSGLLDAQKRQERKNARRLVLQSLGAYTTLARYTRKPTNSPAQALDTSAGTQHKLNNLTIGEMQTLFGVNSTTALALSQSMPFKSWKEVAAVRGVGPTIFARIKERATL